MIKTITTLEELKAELDTYEYNYYGLRGASEADAKKITSGDYDLDESYDWYDGVCSGEKLNGTCALTVSTDISDAEIASRYNTAVKCYAAGNNTDMVILIGGARQEYGNDYDEVIIKNATAVAIVKI